MSRDARRVTVRILLADDHLILRDALKALLEREGLEVVGTASDGRGAVAAARELMPDVVVLDVAMPEMNGIDAAREITRACPGTSVILLTGLDDARFVSQALTAGVRGFVLKTQGAEDLLRAIRAVQRGALYVSPGACQAVIDVFSGTGAPSAGRLSPREREVIQLVAEGKSTKQIAQVLAISVKTAEFHRGRIMGKLDIHDTAGLVRYAVREGLITP